MLVVKRKEIFLLNLHQNRVHFPAERNAFVLDLQHGRRDVTCKPVIAVALCITVTEQLPENYFRYFSKHPKISRHLKFPEKLRELARMFPKTFAENLLAINGSCWSTYFEKVYSMKK